jgi:hypothetical protein
MKFREKHERRRNERDRRKKRAPVGPAKRDAKKLPERRPMIAAVRGRIGPVLGKVSASAAKWSRRADRAANRGLERAHPALLRANYEGAAAARATGAWLGPKLRPAGAVLFRCLAFGEAAIRRGATLAVRAATAASRSVTPRRAIGFLIFAAGAGLVASQFLDYHGVEIGQPGYANLPDVAAAAPAVDLKTAGEAHAWVLVPVGLVAALLGLLGALRERRGYGLLVVALGLAAVAVTLLVDLPSGLDAGAETTRFAGASAVLRDGFFGELAAGSLLILSGLLYIARPCRIRINSSGRAASGRRRRPRRRASSRARVARSA